MVRHFEGEHSFHPTLQLEQVNWGLKKSVYGEWTYLFNDQPAAAMADQAQAMTTQLRLALGAVPSFVMSDCLRRLDKDNTATAGCTPKFL